MDMVGKCMTWEALADFVAGLPEEALDRLESSWDDGGASRDQPSANGDATVAPAA